MIIVKITLIHGMSQIENTSDRRCFIIIMIYKLVLIILFLYYCPRRKNNFI